MWTEGADSNNSMRRTNLVLGVALLSAGLFVSTTQAQPTLSLETQLANKTVSEKAQIKAHGIVARVSVGEWTNNTLRIEIISVKEIQGGVEVLARAWKSGKPLGFSKDGSVEIERFRIFNPPILVEDPAGTIVREWYDKDEDRTLRRTLREDPVEALRQSLAHTISLVGKSNTRIIEGKIGNTTDTYYPAAGANSPVDGNLGRTSTENGGGPSTGTWADIRGGTSANIVDSVSATQNAAQLYDGEAGSAKWDAMTRSIFGFDTSAIGDTDTIDSATLSFYGSASTDGLAGAAVVVDRSVPNSSSGLAAGDFDVSRWDGVEQSTARITISSWVNGSYNNYTLNATGLSNVSKTGITWYGLRHSNDFDNSEPATFNGNSRIIPYFADQTGTTNDPKLVVVHTAVAVVVPPDDTSFELTDW